MISLDEIINSINTIQIEDTKPKKVTFIIDVSGSTNISFVKSMSILEKELSIVYEYILNNSNNIYELYSFGSECVKHKVDILKEEGLVNLPILTSGGSTNTHLPFIQINKNKEKPDIVILITDGETSSSEKIIKEENKKMSEHKIRFEIIAVSAKNINLDTISQSEEQQIPGMELINYLSNSVDKLTIYNQQYKDIPYEGAVSSKINKSYLTFMGSKVVGHVYQYLDILLSKLDEHKGNINWGTGNLIFKKMLSEIGKLLSVYFILFPTEHYFINKITTKIKQICNIAEMTDERILNIIKYGFDCSKKEKPIIFTNFDQHIKEATIKKEEFKNAIDLLKIEGTTLNSFKTICMPTNGMCIINNKVLPMTEYLNNYPKSKDQFGNIYFGCDEKLNEQAIRIAFRELCSQLGYRDVRGPEPAFYVLNEMSLMYIKGIDLDTEHMSELRKLAIIQTSMEVMISKDKYDGIGLYKQWKVGKILAIHYSNPSFTHSQLYKEQKINPLKLEEPLWWALMMSMLGLFEEQKNMYHTALISKGINDETEFLTFIRDTYKNKVSGQIMLYNIKEQPMSVFTLDQFEDDEIYTLKMHGQCNTKTYYSKHEIETYIYSSGCIWCRYIPTWSDFELVNIKRTNHLESISKLMTYSSKLNVLIEQTPITQIFGNNKKILINMIGITGAGKSTVSKKIYDLVTSKGASCLIASADKWSKKGIKGKQIQTSILQEIKNLEKTNNEYKFLIVDICNENGPSSKCFGHDTSDYITINFYPNLEKTKFDEYQCWCLRNVLLRPMHTDTSLYWLNPESAGVSTCIKVHNMKTNGIKKLIGINSQFSFNETLTMEQIMNLLNDKASAYERFLSSKNLDDIVTELVKSSGFQI